MVRKKPLSAADVSLVQALLQEVQPHMVFAAGDLSGGAGALRAGREGRCVRCCVSLICVCVCVCVCVFLFLHMCALVGG